MKILLVIIGFLFLPAIAAADAEYVVRQEGAGMCYLDGESKSAAQRCGQCVKDAGDAVSRIFRVFCKNDDSDEFLKTEKKVQVNLDCDDSKLESKDDKWWKQEAEKGMESLLPFEIFRSQCDLEEWSWWAENKSIIIGTGVAVLAVGVVLVKAETDEESGYTIKKKEGKSGECRKGHKPLNGIKYCHNCKDSGGDTIVRKYDVFCNGKSVGKRIEGILQCKRSIPKEGEQEDMLLKNAEARLTMELEAWSKCEAR